MKKNLLFIFMMQAVFVCGCIETQKTQPLPEEMQPEQIKSVMTKVADWQLANPSKHHTADWTHAALFAGMTAWAQMADSDTYYDALIGFGEKNSWQPHKRKYHADDHAVAQMYIELYKKYRDPKMIAPIQQRFDWILANQPDTPLTHDKREHKKRYNWCDALFMAPPVWAKLARVTGETKYLDYMNKEWWATTDYLYDKKEHLYFRDDRYFAKREANGKKVFWSRGNGWVLGGYVRVLEELPEDHPDRPRYEKLYKQMAAKILAIQPGEGLWHSSLLDPVNFPSKEASGSGFYCYGLAWGINHGLLDEAKYLPAVMKAWVGLVGCVHPNGKLGNVQPIGADPRHVTADQTEIYGVGSFLLAGSEVYKIAIRKGASVKQVIVTNPAAMFRDNETVSVNWEDAKKAVKGLTKDNVAVLDFKTNSLLVTQVVEGDASSELLFQTDMAPGAKKYFWVMKQPAGTMKPEPKLTTFCRFVPERKDDFAWENDKVVFRMYGPALEVELLSCGIDAWSKNVPSLVFDKMLASGQYHTNNGQGGDFYSVGPTLGCGGMAPLVDDKKIVMGRNFAEWKVIANGPIRSIFELRYYSWKVDDESVSEVKRVTIDLGSSLTKFECTYSSGDVSSLTVGSGIVLRGSKSKFVDTGIAGYWQKAGTNGMMGCGTVFANDRDTRIAEVEGHLMQIVSGSIDKPVVYYTGTCWDAVKEFDSFVKWQEYLKNYKRRIDSPVSVQFAD